MSPDRVLHKFKLLHQKVNSMDRRVLAALVEEVKTAKVALRGGGGGGGSWGSKPNAPNPKKDQQCLAQFCNFFSDLTGLKPDFL